MRHLKGSLSLRLASKLNLAARRNSLAHSTKGTPSPRRAAPTACRRTVSGTVSLPSRGAFHLSLTVLVHYRSQESIQPWRVVPPASHRVSRVRRYSGVARRSPLRLRLRGWLPSAARPSRRVRLPCGFLTARPALWPGPRAAPQPPCSNPQRVCACMGLGSVRFRSPLLAQSRLISLPPGT